MRAPQDGTGGCARRDRWIRPCVWHHEPLCCRPGHIPDIQQCQHHAHRVGDGSSACARPHRATDFLMTIARIAIAGSDVAIARVGLGCSRIFGGRELTFLCAARRSSTAGRYHAL